MGKTRMGSIQKQVDSQKDLTVYTVLGKVSAGQVRRAILKFYEDDITMKVLWDLSKSDVSSLTTTEIQGVAFTSRKLANMRKGGKTAIVAPENITYGLSRKYELLTNTQNLPFETQAFRTTEEAYQWLLEPE